ncbi:helix-turn-helix domain-containing protein [Paenarthrobacter nicotinovorans]|uniref:helix-turn-helix domain-containing protein n=1 Tax=Paenarthrobacter nicotinovorans TaxID=29320 RepID=UPI0011A22E05|nr:helix-turn-helix domain-containing protein [Paenarthrobacter nicotinovorans]
MSTTTLELTTPEGTGRAIQARRKALGLTQQQVADTAHVSRKLLAEIEAGHPRAEFGKLLQIFAALKMGLAAIQETTPPDRVRLELGLAQEGRSLDPRTRNYQQLFAELLRHKDYEFALKQLSEYVTASLAEGRPLLEQEPSLASKEWTAALAAATALIARRLGQERPAWTRFPRLAFPWFPAETYRPVAEKMKELTKQQTPEEFAELNVFIRERSLVNA